MRISDWSSDVCSSDLSLVKGNPLECRCYVGIAIFDISIAIGIGGILQEAAVDEHGAANIKPQQLGHEPVTRSCFYLMACKLARYSIGVAPLTARETVRFAVQPRGAIGETSEERSVGQGCVRKCSSRWSSNT